MNLHKSRCAIWLSGFAGVLAMVCVLLHPSVTAAAPASFAAPTVIHIDPVKPIYAGQSFAVTGILYRHTNDGNAGVPNRAVALYIEPLTSATGVVSKTLRVATVFSDSQGHLKWTVHKSLGTGRYRLYFLFAGTAGLQHSFATTELVVNGPVPAQTVLLSVMPLVSIEPGDPATVTARLTTRTQRPLANQTLTVNLPGATQQRKTDAQGMAVFVIQKPLTTGVNLGKVRYEGQQAYRPAEQSIQLIVNPRLASKLVFTAVGDKPLYVGDELAFTARLTSGGRPLLNRLVRFYLNGELRYGAKTDADGKAVLRLPRNLVAGSHVLSATFRGANNLLESTDTLPVALLPRPFEVRTVPPLPDVTILIGEQRIRTDARGIARVLVQKSGAVSATVLPYESPDPNVRAVFIRWSDDVASATRRINVVNGAMLQIGFEVSHPVQPRFVEESAGRQVNVNRLSQIMLVNSLGEAVPITVGVQWLKANRITRHDNVLRAAALSYQLLNVTVDGVNVVNEGQQKYKVAPRDLRWTMKLQMHDLTVTTRDALFGFPIGSGVRVTYPMGQLQDVALDASGRMRMESLSRGSYTVTVQGGFFIRAPTPVALSRSQFVDLPVISYLDVGIVVVALMGLALFVLLWGRSQLFARRAPLRRTQKGIRIQEHA